MMYEETQAYQQLFDELAEFEKSGIHIMMDGEPASPMQIAAAHMVQEESGYMRDYVLDEDGQLSELCFDRIKVNS